MYKLIAHRGEKKSSKENNNENHEKIEEYIKK